MLSSVAKPGAVVVAALFWLSMAAAASESRPNFVFLDICSARADHFGSYGYGRATTPLMDGLAKRSAVFENAMAQSSWCLPNYASLFTGQVPEVHGDYVNEPHPLPEFEATLAEKLKESGYKTAAFSGGVYMIPAWGLDKGFDTYVNIFSTSDAEHLPASFGDNLQSVLAWLEKNGTSAPLFAYVAVDDLHEPYRSREPEKYDPGYQGIADDTETLSVPFSRAYNGEPGDYSAELLDRVARFKKDPRHLKHLIARYDASLSQVDSEVGRFLLRLKALGLDKSTVVVITGDHGQMLGEHGLLGHTEGLYEGVLHVPLILHDPSRPGTFGKRYPQLVERVDLMPTLLDMAGVDASGLGLQGQSLKPLLDGRAAAWRDYAFASSKRNLDHRTDMLIDERAARDGRWKLLHYLYKPGFELYDLKADPQEAEDVSRGHPEIVGKLSFELLRNVELTRPHQPGPPEGSREDSGFQFRAVPSKN